MMNKLSIKLRVTIWYTLVMLVISISVVFAISSVSQEMIMRESTNRVTRCVNDFAERSDFGRAGNMRKMRDFHFFEQGVHMAVYNDEHTLINGFMPFEFADDIDLEDYRLSERTVDGHKFLSYVRNMELSDGESVWVIGVVSVADESRLLNSVVFTNIIVTGVLLIVAAIGGYMIIKHAFKPVDKISGTAKAISEGNDLSQRIALGEGNDEIYRLAHTFDEMLDKIEHTLENEKQFTADASHELRTPVAVINSECEYVLDCVNEIEEAKESVRTIKRQSDKMAKLISELLTISRMDRNTQSVCFEETDISELLSFVCDEQREIHNQPIELITDIKPNISAKADHILIARVFINLISNAYQYGVENGHIRVLLDEDENNVVFRVADDGIGIESKYLDKIWERFYQVDSSRTNENGSMGLGLSMVKWIVDVHKGKIEVESTPGEGTVFTFTMPKNM